MALNSTSGRLEFDDRTSAQANFLNSGLTAMALSILSEGGGIKSIGRTVDATFLYGFDFDLACEV